MSSARDEMVNTMPPFDAAASRRRCLAYRRRILDMSQQVTALHVAPAFFVSYITFGSSIPVPSMGPRLLAKPCFLSTKRTLRK